MATLLRSAVGPQIPQLWSTKLLAQAESMTFWQKFEGPEGSSMPIIRKDDLTKTPGDTIKQDMVLALTGAGVTGDTTSLAGNEEAMKFRQLSIAVDALAHAVRWSELVEVLINYEQRSTALNQLAKWLSGKLDDAVWSELTGGGTTIPVPNLWYAGTATSINTLADSDAVGRLKLNDISEARAVAQATLKIEPLKTQNGEEYYGLVLDPMANLALKKDASYQQAQRDANVRGESNPLFSGATFVWDGVIGYVNNRVPTGTNTNTPAIRYSKNVLFGAQALGRGYAQYPDWREEDFDYGRQTGVATTLVKGEKVSLFDLSAAGDGSGNTCIGHMVVHSAAVAPTA